MENHFLIVSSIQIYGRREIIIILCRPGEAKQVPLANQYEQIFFLDLRILLTGSSCMSL